MDTCLLVADDVQEIMGATQYAVSSLSYAELQFGVGCATDTAGRASRLARLERIRLNFGSGLPLDDNVAISYGIIAQAVVDAGRAVRGRQLDLLIAATAHANRAALATANVADFRGLDGIVKIIEV